MKKRILITVLAVVIMICSALPVSAGTARLADNAGLLSASENSRLLSKLDEISQRQNFDIVIVTVDSLGGKSAMEYADDYYDYNGYLQDGVLLLVSMEARDWWVSTAGFGITAITDAGLEYMSDKFLPYLSDGEYFKAFDKFAALCDDFVTKAKTGSAYDKGNLPKEPFPVFMFIFISLAAGFIVAFAAVSVMKGKLKSVRRQHAANSYIKAGSVNITDSRDMFLYSKLDRRLKPQTSSGSGGGSFTHTSSSGRTHGGGGGKF